jgi:hypothetical protein
MQSAKADSPVYFRDYEAEKAQGGKISDKLQNHFVPIGT